MTTTDLIKTVIDPGMLDRVGKLFKFQHGKGVSEWLKNSLDEYLRRLNSGQRPDSTAHQLSGVVQDFP